MFGNLGFGEMLIILVVGLVVIGPKKLPELARSLGKGVNEFRRAALDLKTSLSVELEEDERRTKLTPPPASRTPSPPRAETPTVSELQTTKPDFVESAPSIGIVGPPVGSVARSNGAAAAAQALDPGEGGAGEIRTEHKGVPQSF